MSSRDNTKKEKIDVVYVANLARLSVKYATFFIPRPHVPSNLSGVPWQIISYSLWGLAAGLVVGLGMLVVEFQKRRAKR